MKKKLFKEKNQKIIKSLHVQLFFNSKEYKLMFLDEFFINFSQISIYGWGPIGDN